MRQFAFVIALLACSMALADQAGDIMAAYQAMPYDNLGPMRSARLQQLRKLRDLPVTEVVPAVAAAMKDENDAGRRAEMVEVLRDFPTQAAANVLVQSLKDSDAHVRYYAVLSLRMLSRRVDRMGDRRDQRGAEFEPKVPGLVPDLIRAADDPDETVRSGCLYALADTLDPTATDRLRLALKDPSTKIRFQAACFLTEFNDASGLGELKVALPRLRDDRQNVMRFSDIGRLVASLERLTGKSFGKLPMNPQLSSQSGAAQRDGPAFDRMLDAWIQWWAWEPAAKD